MATTTARRPVTLNRVLLKPLSALATAGLLGALAFAISIKAPSATPLEATVAAGIFAIAAWMFFSRRYEWSLAILMLYIGLVDGYLKLRTGSSHTTLLRDVLLYAVAAGALVRFAIRRERIRWPPLSGWIFAWLLVIAIQLANPADGTFYHSLASIRPLAEWVPLFFLGYLTMRSKRRLRAFLFLLLVIAAVNGVVGLVQLNLTPEQLATWGPGYQQAINGEGDVSGRTFVDNEGTARTRPFALGGDFGFGGSIGVIAVPAALALLALSRKRSLRLAGAALGVGVALAVITSQARVAIIASIVAAFAFACLTVTSRTGLRTVLAVGLAVLLGYATVGILSSDSSRGTFDHYESISGPEKAVETALEYRQGTMSRIPKYAVEFPLGAGIGQAGPAASVAGGNRRGLDAESEPTYLLIEVGIPGLVVIVGFFGTLFWVCLTRIRKIGDHETRILLTGIAAPLFAIFISGYVGIDTANVPHAPYLWFSAGVLSYWLLGEGRAPAPSEPGRIALQPQPALAC